ncbi:MAG: pyridoxamine 5'-phosphate oxidase family protein [Anaerolineales bacterium]
MNGTASDSRPTADRPHMPDYGILPSDQGRGLLPWSWAAERLAAAHNYWFATTRPDGRPHLMAVWGVWLQDRFCFSTAGSSVKARNLRHNPRCAVSTESGAEAVIVEGTAEAVGHGPLRARIESAYVAKYGEGFPDDSDFMVVRPRVVFAFIETGEDFVGAATRWTFA